MRVLIRLIAGVGLACALLSAHAGTLVVNTVTDAAHVLNPSEVAALEEKIERMEVAGAAPVTVLTVSSLEGEDPDAFFMRQAKVWGHPGDSRGVLIGVATAERKIRLEVSRSLGDVLPSAAAQAIAHDVMAPKLRAGDYAGGIADALDAIEARTIQSAATASQVAAVQQVAQSASQPASAQEQSGGALARAVSIQDIIGALLPIFGGIAVVAFVFRRVYGDDTPSSSYRTSASTSTSTKSSPSCTTAARSVQSRQRDSDDLVTTAAAVYLMDRASNATSRDDSSQARSSDSGSSWSDYSSSSSSSSSTSDYSSSSSSDYSSSGSDY